MGFWRALTLLLRPLSAMTSTRYDAKEDLRVLLRGVAAAYTAASCLDSCRSSSNAYLGSRDEL